MLLSKTCEYGLRAMLHLAATSPDGYKAVRVISSELDISFHFLTKIFQQLTRSGLLMSYRGPNGGVKLARESSEITLKEIVVAIEGPELFTECVLGLPGCGDERPCPMHHSWAVVRTELERMLDHKNLEKLGCDITIEGFRLRSAIKE